MIIHGDVAFMILATTLVLIMTPGLAFFYGGLVERKNALTIMFQVFIAIGIVALLWIFGGFSLVFGDDIGGVIGNPLQFFAFNNITFKIDLRYSETIPFILFQFILLIIAILYCIKETFRINRYSFGSFFILLTNNLFVICSLIFR